MVERRMRRANITSPGTKDYTRVLVALGEKYDAGRLIGALNDQGFAALDAERSDAVSLSRIAHGSKFLIMDEGIQLSLPPSSSRTFQIVLGEDDSSSRIAEVLNNGADTLLKYPVDPRLLIAHMNSMLRREMMSTQKKLENPIVEFNGLVYDNLQRALFKDGKHLKLRAKENDILQFLLKNIDAPVTNQEITEAVWHFDYDGSTMGSIRSHMFRLRSVLDGCDVPSEKSMIQGIPRLGYMLKSKNSGNE